MAQSKQYRDKRRARNEGEPQQKRSSDRQPREEPNRQNVESPSQQREGDRNPSVNQPIPGRDDRAPSDRTDEDDPSQSRRPGGSGDMSRGSDA